MGPERSGTVSDHLKEEYGFDRRCCLDQMFTKKEPAFAEVWTGANPTVRVRSIFDVEWNSNGFFQGSLPVPFERFSPGRQLSEATYVPCGQVEFTIIGWGHFRHKNPDKKVNTRLMKMVQKVFLNPPPAVHGR